MNKEITNVIANVMEKFVAVKVTLPGPQLLPPVTEGGSRRSAFFGAKKGVGSYL